MSLLHILFSFPSCRTVPPKFAKYVGCLGEISRQIWLRIKENLDRCGWSIRRYSNTFVGPRTEVLRISWRQWKIPRWKPRWRIESTIASIYHQRPDLHARIIRILIDRLIESNPHCNPRTARIGNCELRLSGWSWIILLTLLQMHGHVQYIGARVRHLVLLGLAKGGDFLILHSY